MKLEFNDKIKHRLIGLAVLFSIALIFLPAAFKKSNQRLDNDLTMNIKLPPKPSVKTLAEKDEQVMFQHAKLAKVDLQAVPEESQLPQLSRAKPLEKHQLAHNEPVNNEPQLKKKGAPKQQLVLNTKPELTVTNKQISSKKTLRINTSHHKQEKKTLSNKATSYSVQLAVFSQYSNAASLKRSLLEKGYPVKITKLNKKGKTLYKVYVGEEDKQQQANRLKEKLALNYNLHGFVVKGVA
jgi:DedD protein